MGRYDIPGQGVFEFPDDMSDDQVMGVLKQQGVLGGPPPEPGPTAGPPPLTYAAPRGLGNETRLAIERTPDLLEGWMRLGPEDQADQIEMARRQALMPGRREPGDPVVTSLRPRRPDFSRIPPPAPETPKPTPWFTKETTEDPRWRSVFGLPETEEDTQRRLGKIGPYAPKSEPAGFGEWLKGVADVAGEAAVPHGIFNLGKLRRLLRPSQATGEIVQEAERGLAAGTPGPSGPGAIGPADRKALPPYEGPAELPGQVLRPERRALPPGEGAPPTTGMTWQQAMQRARQKVDDLYPPPQKGDPFVAEPETVGGVPTTPKVSGLERGSDEYKRLVREFAEREMAMDPSTIQAGGPKFIRGVKGKAGTSSSGVGRVESDVSGPTGRERFGQKPPNVPQTEGIGFKRAEPALGLGASPGESKVLGPGVTQGPGPPPIITPPHWPTPPGGAGGAGVPPGGAAGAGPPQGLANRARQGAAKISYSLSPDQLRPFERDAYANEAKNILVEHVKKMAYYMSTEGAKEASIFGKVKSNSADDMLLSQMMHDVIPPNMLATYPQHVADAYRKVQAHIFAEARKVGIAPQARLVDMLPQYLSKDEVTQRLQGLLPQFAHDPAKHGAIAKKLTDLAQGGRVNTTGLPPDVMLAYYQSVGTPEHGAKAIWRAFVGAMGDDLFLKPGFKQIDDKNLVGLITDRPLREHVVDFMKRFRDKPYDPISAPEQFVKNLQFLRTLGFNLRWPFVNATQSILTGFEIGPRAAWAGLNGYMSDAGRAFYLASGHKELGLLRGYFGDAPKLHKAATAVGDYVEQINRGTAYIGTLWDKVGRPDMATFEKMLAQGHSAFPKSAIYAADDVVRHTQGFYGKLGNPALLETAGIRSLAQYQAVPLKIMQWMVNNKTKAAGYLGVMAAMDETIRAAGHDVPSIGVGLDVQGAVKEYMDSKDMKRTVEALVAPAAAGRLGILGLGLGPISSSWAAAKRAAGDVRKGEYWGALEGVAKGVSPVAVNRLVGGFQTGAFRGGSPVEAIAEGLGYKRTKTEARDSIIRDLRDGNFRKAANASAEWKKLHGDDLLGSIPAGSKADFMTEGNRKRRERREDAAERTADDRGRGAFSPWLRWKVR